MTNKAGSDSCSPTQLVTNILSYLEKNDYRHTTIEKHKKFYFKFLRFMEENGIKDADAECISNYLRFLKIPVSGTIRKTSHYFKRSALRKLYQFKRTGLFRTKNNEWPPLPEHYGKILDSFVANEIEKKAIHETSVRKMRQELRAFFLFLLDKKIESVELIDASHFNAFVKYMERKFTRATIANHVKYIRMMVRFLVSIGQATGTLLKAIPQIRYVRKIRIPDVWPREAIMKLLSGIDTNSASGKRDYAIFLLAIRLGIRIGDICSLKFEHINWERGILSFPMQKTKNRIELPLTEEIGSALIDYLKNGRPDVKNEQIVFLSHRPLFRPIGNGYNIIHKHLKAAGISLAFGSRKGFHSLRYTLATRLHEANVPFSVISAILGHSSIDTTRIYAKANIEMLRSVAIDWKEAENE